MSMMTEKLYQGDEKNLMNIFRFMKEDQLNVAIDKISVSFSSYKSIFRLVLFKRSLKKRMDSLHVRLTFNPAKTNKIFYNS